MRFAVFTNVQHKEREGKFYAYAPYIREMNIWLRHVKEVEVVAPLVTWGRVENEIKYIHGDLNFTRIPPFHFLGFFSAVKALFKIPFILYRIFGTMHKADHLHLRCPGNIGLLACISQIFFPGKPKSAKYAGNWDPSAKQPWSYRLQKWILSNTFLTRNMQVLVYGEWPGQSKNIVPFFTASFSEDEKEGVPKMAFMGSFKFLFVGNLVEGKRPLEAIRLVEELNVKLRGGLDTETGNSSARLEIYGEGPERRKLKKYVVDHNLEGVVNFRGSRPLEELKAAYQQAHFVLLLSRSEGWPKAIAEGMFFGCIPIATPMSCVPWMLNYGSRGVLLEEFNQQSTSDKQELKKSGQRTEDRGQDILKITQLLVDQEKMIRMSEAAKEWSQQYTLERFEKAIKKVLLHPNEEVTVANGKLSPAPFRDGAERGKSKNKN